jgi:hypothetical protein
MAGPHGGLHSGQPHRLLPDRLRLASSWLSRSAGRGDPGRICDPGIPCGQPWEGFFFLFKNPRKIVFPF